MPWLFQYTSSLTLRSRETFLLADVHVLEAVWWAVRIPLRALPRDEDVLLPPVSDSDIDLLVCDQTLFDGSVCSAAFPTKTALAVAPNPQQETRERGQKMCRLRRGHGFKLSGRERVTRPGSLR